MFAVVEIGKKQYIVRKGDVLDVQKMESSSENIAFDRVMLVAGEKQALIGKPYLEGAQIKVKVEGQKKGKKIIVYKVKKRKKYRRKQGHRQNYTTIKITDIVSTLPEVRQNLAKKPEADKISAKKTVPRKATPKKSTQKTKPDKSKK